VGLLAGGARLAVGSLAGAAGIGGLAVAFGGAATAGISFNNQLEQADIAFTTMLGSGEKAQVFLNELKAFAAATPFEFPDLVDASQKLLAMGFAAKDVRPLLTDVGNAAAAMGSGASGVDAITRALGQMKATTTVQLGEINQLTEQGIPGLQLLADHLGITTSKAREMIEQGEVSADTFIEAFEEFAGNNYGGMMAKQAKTASGAWSTLKDNVRNGLATAFKPTYETLRDILLKAGEFTGSDGFQDWLKAAGERSSVLLKNLSELAGKIGKGFGDTFDLDAPKPQGWEQAGKTAGTKFVSAVNAEIRAEAANADGEGSPGYEFGFKTGKSVSGGLNAAITSIGDTIKTEGLVGAIKKDLTSSDWKPVGMNFASELGKGFREGMQGQNWSGVTTKEWNKIRGDSNKTWSSIANNIGKSQASARKRASGENKSLGSALKGIWNNIRGNANNSWSSTANAIGQKSKMGAQKATSENKGLAGNLKSIWNGIKGNGNSTWSSIANNIGQKNAEARKKGVQENNSLKTQLGNIWNQTKNTAGSAWDAIGNLIVNASEAAKTKVIDTWNAMLNFVANVLSKLGFKDAASDVRSGTGPGTGDTGQGRQSGGFSGPGNPNNMARGGVEFAEGGGLSGPRQPKTITWGEGPSDEAAIFVTKDRRHRRDNEKYASVAANLLGGRFIPEKDVKRMGHVSGVGEGLGPTHYNVDKDVRAEADRIASATGTAWNTYSGHGLPGGSTEDRTVDFWGGARGTSLSPSQGYKVADMVLAGGGPDPLYIIRQGEYWRGGAWQAWPEDPHYDHTHVSYNAGDGSGAGGDMAGAGFTTITNPEQTKFEKLWKPVQAYSDKAVAALGAMHFTVAKGQGFLTDRSTSAMRSAIDKKIPDTISGPKTGPETGPSNASGGGSPSANEALGQKMLPQSGTPGSFSALDSLWTKESGWDHTAQNPTSSAFGIPQFLDATWASYGGKSFDPPGQIDKGLRYISDRYGSTDDAWGHSQSVGWYAKGGVVPGPKGSPQRAIVHGGEHITPSDGTARMQAPETDARLDALLKRLDGLPKEIGDWVKEGVGHNAERGPRFQGQLLRGMGKAQDSRSGAGPVLGAR